MQESRNVFVQEVGPRDGLQNEARTLSPEVRAKLIEDLVSAGLPRIQIGSFVNPKRVPQMADTDKVWKLLTLRENVRYSVLVLNERGLDQALQAGIPHVEIFVSASETHSRKNSNSTVEQALQASCTMIKRAKREGMTVTAGVMCALGCHYEGTVSVEKVTRIVEAYQPLEPDEIGLADTTGMGTPQLVKQVIEALAGTVTSDRIAFHFHDTHGHGLANLKAGLAAGVRCFDSSVGGIGGCPFVPGAKGNISTTDTVNILESQGFDTGVCLSGVRDVLRRLQELLGRELP